MTELSNEAPEVTSGDDGISEPSEPVRQLLDELLPLMEGEGWDGAAEALRDGLARFPDDPYLLSWLGMAERELGLDSIALERFRHALSSNPRDPVLLATVGNALAAWDDPEAEGALRTAALLAPGLAQARWMYGAWLAREGMVEEGVAELEAALLLEPEDPLIHTEHGVALALAGNGAGAQNAFRRAAELDPEDGWVLSLLGLSLLEGGDAEEAVRSLDEAARLREEDAELQLLAALGWGSEGHEDRALEMLERARLHGEGILDSQSFDEVEEALEEGRAASRTLWERHLAPSSFRERLMQRP
jgi:Flp pilus assembly protein TadD